MEWWDAAAATWPFTKRGRRHFSRLAWLYLGDTSMGRDRQQKPHGKPRRAA